MHALSTIKLPILPIADETKRDKDISCIRDLLSFTAPQALLTMTPTYKEVSKGRGKICIINYTPQPEQRYLLQKIYDAVVSHTREHLHALAYQVEGFPEITCIEAKDVTEVYPVRRMYIEKSSYGYKSTSCFDIYNAALLAVRPQSIDQQDFKADERLASLRGIARPEAILKKDFTIERFLIRDDLGKLLNPITIFNHTPYNLAFDIKSNLYVNEKPLIKFSTKNRYIHAYTLEKHPLLLCLDNQKLHKDPQHYNIYNPQWHAITKWDNTNIESPRATFIHSWMWGNVTSHLHPSKALLRRPYDLQSITIPEKLKKSIPHHTRPQAYEITIPENLDSKSTVCKVMNYTALDVTVDMLKHMSFDAGATLFVYYSKDTHDQANVDLWVGNKIRYSGTSSLRPTSPSGKLHLNSILMEGILENAFSILWRGSLDLYAPIYRGLFPKELLTRIMDIYLQLKSSQFQS
jgi:hypothetical protein